MSRWKMFEGRGLICVHYPGAVRSHPASLYPAVGEMGRQQHGQIGPQFRAMERTQMSINLLHDVCFTSLSPHQAPSCSQDLGIR